MEQELKNDLIASWNEAEELHTSLTTLTDEEIIECKGALIERVNMIKHWLGKYVNESDVIQELKHEKEYVQRISWDSVKADCKYPIDDNNNGFIYGLNYIDFEGEGDITEVEWFETSEERETAIIDGNYIVVFDE